MTHDQHEAARARLIDVSLDEMRAVKAMCTLPTKEALALLGLTRSGYCMRLTMARRKAGCTTREQLAVLAAFAGWAQP